MKKVILSVLLLVPLALLAQERPDLVFSQVMLTPKPDKIAEFEAGMASHNKKYHNEGVQQANVYWISNGKNSGKYIWSAGPIPWAAMDAEHPDKANHDGDWNKNIAPYTKGNDEAFFFRADLANSNFSKDFTIKNMSVFMIDIKRFKNMEFLEELKKVRKVYAEKMPEKIFGIYHNTMPANDDRNFNRDFGWVEFFDSMSVMGEEDKFPQYFEEVHGAGSFAKFLQAFGEITNGDMTELWTFRADLSGTDGKILAAERQ
jgi:hypothetical protein